MIRFLFFVLFLFPLLAFCDESKEISLNDALKEISAASASFNSLDIKASQAEKALQIKRSYKLVGLVIEQLLSNQKTLAKAKDEKIKELSKQVVDCRNELAEFKK